MKKIPKHPKVILVISNRPQAIPLAVIWILEIQLILYSNMYLIIAPVAMYLVPKLLGLDIGKSQKFSNFVV